MRCASCRRCGPAPVPSLGVPKNWTWLYSTPHIEARNVLYSGLIDKQHRTNASVDTDLCRTSAGDTPRGKARCLKSHPTCSAPQYKLHARGVLAIFAFGVNYLSLQRKDGFGDIIGIASMERKDNAFEYSGDGFPAVSMLNCWQ